MNRILPTPDVHSRRRFFHFFFGLNLFLPLLAIRVIFTNENHQEKQIKKGE